METTGASESPATCFLSGTGKPTRSSSITSVMWKSGYDFVRVLAVDASGATIREISTLTGAGGTPGATASFRRARCGDSRHDLSHSLRFHVGRSVFRRGRQLPHNHRRVRSGQHRPFPEAPIQQGTTPLAVTFDSGLQGYVPETIPGVGAQVGTALASSYTYGSSCGLSTNGLSGNVIEVHDDADQHPGQAA